MAINRLRSIMTDPRMIVTAFMFLLMYLLKQWGRTENTTTLLDSSTRLEYLISRTWDDQPIKHDPIKITLLPHNDAGIRVHVDAPFFNDPDNPGGDPGMPFDGLWEFEVVEVFFLNSKDQYLEIELSPHGQHLVLLLDGYRKKLKDKLPLEFTATITGNTWHGEAVIPAVYFPKQVYRMNAYAIHGTGEGRTYEALYPVPTGEHTDPDFHRLNYFDDLDISELLPSNIDERYESSLWPAENR